MLSHYVQLHARLFGSMRALLHACLARFFCLSLRLHALPLCALGHNNGSDVCARSECPDETVHCPGSSELSMLAYKQTNLSYQLACVFIFFFCDFVPEEKTISCLKKSEAKFSSISKYMYILH